MHWVSGGADQSTNNNDHRRSGLTLNLQTGSIFFDCKICGSFVTSEYSDVIIRDNNFNILKSNQKGFVQLLSSLPTSYPGHSILTEDIGEIVENNCKCKKIGKRFLIHGRSIKSEVRGCSDV